MIRVINIIIDRIMSRAINKIIDRIINEFEQ